MKNKKKILFILIIVIVVGILSWLVINLLRNKVSDSSNYQQKTTKNEIDKKIIGLQKADIPNNVEQGLISDMRRLEVLLEEYKKEHGYYAQDLNDLEVKEINFDTLKEAGFVYVVYDKGIGYKMSLPLRNQLSDLMKNDGGENDKLYEIMKK